MTDVEIPVRLGRKASLHPAAILLGLQVAHNDVPNKIRGSACVFRGHSGRSLSFGVGSSHLASILTRNPFLCGAGSRRPSPYPFGGRRGPELILSLYNDVRACFLVPRSRTARPSVIGCTYTKVWSSQKPIAKVANSCTPTSTFLCKLSE